MYIAQCQGFVHCSPTTTYCSAGSVRIVSVKLILIAEQMQIQMQSWQQCKGGAIAECLLAQR